MSIRIQFIVLSCFTATIVPSCAEPEGASTRDEHARFQTRISELGLADGTHEVRVEPSILATDAIVIYSEPGHRPIVAAFDHAFSGTAEGDAMIERLTEDAEVVMKVDLRHAAFGAQLVSPPERHEGYSYELWGRSPDGSLLAGIEAEQELEHLRGFASEELREHDASRVEEALSERAVTCCYCNGANCGCRDCGASTRFFCNCVHCEASCEVIITNPTTGGTT